MYMVQVILVLVLLLPVAHIPVGISPFQFERPCHCTKVFLRILQHSIQDMAFLDRVPILWWFPMYLYMPALWFFGIFLRFFLSERYYGHLGEGAQRVIFEPFTVKTAAVIVTYQLLAIMSIGESRDQLRRELENIGVSLQLEL